MKLIERPQYLEKMIDVMGTPDIKVITRVSRSGKSKLLEMFKAHIEKQLPNANIIHINFNLPEYDECLNNKALYNHIKAQYKPGSENFVLIDEVQMCDGFGKAINTALYLVPARSRVISRPDSFGRPVNVPLSS